MLNSDIYTVKGFILSPKFSFSVSPMSLKFYYFYLNEKACIFTLTLFTDQHNNNSSISKELYNRKFHMNSNELTLFDK